MVLYIFNISENIERIEQSIDDYLQEDNNIFNVDMDIDVDVDVDYDYDYDYDLDFGIICNHCDNVQYISSEDSRCSICDNLIEMELFVGENSFLDFDDL